MNGVRSSSASARSAPLLCRAVSEVSTVAGLSEVDLEHGLGLGAEGTDASAPGSTPEPVPREAAATARRDGPPRGLLDCCKRWRRGPARSPDHQAGARRGFWAGFRSAPRPPTSANAIQQQIHRRRRMHKAGEVLSIILLIGGIDLMLWRNDVVFRAFCFGVVLSGLLLYCKIYRRLSGSEERQTAEERAEAMRELVAKFPVMDGGADHSHLPADSGSCPICLDTFEAGMDQMILPCFHRFHSSCATQWLQDHAKCPVCRCDLVDVVHESNSL